ncbi:class I SAM-dependent methyltransferase [Flavobacterium coralii]|uniref:class I SAM-dependent methyltransferase n=1 Tax=Flavobacterium coralii TaxID=2838017 RepID=UPI000C5CA3E7|nr:methyltransferase [Flavobacterium sp.]|tara:strand:+ start:90949 stop:91818 length:870 start_codon:yes stop_codon:yes gene_type:complete
MDFTNAPVYLTVKDFSVSGEEFTLMLNEELQLLKTHPQPSAENLGRYYESEDYISHTDGKRTLFEKLYHVIKQKALKDKVNFVTGFKPGKGNLLDIGSGTGDFLVAAKNAGWSITGVEPSEKAKSIAKQKGVVFTEDLAALADNSFDAITMWHVLEHVPDVEKQIAELKRIVKPDGVIVIAVPNFKSYDAQHYGAHWAAYDVPRHLWHFSKTAVQKLFSAQGMEVVKVLPMIFDSFYVSLLSEKYKTGKMNFIKGFWVGLQSNTKAAHTKEYSSHIYVIKMAKTQNKAI